MKTETNCYAQQLLSAMKRNLEPKNTWHCWKTVTISEIEKFFTIILHMCLIGSTNLTDYWSTNESTFASDDWRLFLSNNVHVSAEREDE